MRIRRLLAAVLLAALLAPAVRAQEQPCYVALTFDDGPSGRFTRRLLEELAQRRVLATFFLCGYRVEQYQELTAQIASDGHEIGCHGQTHESFRELSQMALCSELECSMERITTAAGQRPTLLRPPGGVFEPERLAQTVCADLPVVLWSVDPKDWRRSDADGIAAEVIEAVRPGDIILLHDMSDSSVDAALTIIDTLQARGVEFATVSELARRAGTELTAGTAYRSIPFPSEAKNASNSEREAATEPCTNPAFPPPRPWQAALRRRTSSRRSPVLLARAY